MHEITCVWQTWRINSSVIWNLLYMWKRVKIVGVLSSTSRWNIMKACKLQENTEDAEAEIPYFAFLIFSYMLILTSAFGHHSFLCLWFLKDGTSDSMKVLSSSRYSQQILLLILQFTRCCFPLLVWKHRVFRDAVSCCLSLVPGWNRLCLLVLLVGETTYSQIVCIYTFFFFLSRIFFCCYSW